MNPSSEQRGKVWILYPFLFVVGVLLAKLLTQAHELSPADALWPALWGLCVSLLLLGVFQLLLRDRHKAGLALLLLMVLAGANPAVERLVLGWSSASSLAAFYLPAGLSLLLFVVVLVCLSRMQRPLEQLSRALNWAGGFAVAFLLFRLAYHEFTIDHAALRQPVSPAGTVKTPPNVFYIILDRYPRADLLRDEFHYDNQEFLDYLRGQGFFIAGQAHCNYANSLLSLWSSLNMAFLPEEVLPAQVSRDLRATNRVGEFFLSQGYRYVHLGNWYSPTSRCALADNRLCPASLGQLDLGCVRGASEWLYQWSYQLNHGRMIQFQLDEIAALARTPGPLLVVAHVLLPHEPYVFSADGDFQVLLPMKENEALFVEQLRYTNDRLRELIDHILAHSDRPAVIILQGDEGPYPADSAALTAAERFRYRNAIFNAYRLPGLDPAMLRPTLTPANTFRLILNHYFGTALDLLPDTTFRWGDPPREFSKRKAYRFTDAGK
jgi:hypothetical protein